MSAAATPATVAAAIAARKTQTAPAAAVKVPSRRHVPAPRRGVPVTLTLRPKTLTDWKRWTLQLGCSDAVMDSTGECLTALITVGGERVRLVGEGVPALIRNHQSRRSAGVREVAHHA